MSTGSDNFIVVTTPEAAVDRLAELYQQAVDALTGSLKCYLKDRTRPDVEQLRLFRDGHRANSAEMFEIADRMSDRDIAAVADYAAGLR